MAVGQGFQGLSSNLLALNLNLSRVVGSGTVLRRCGEEVENVNGISNVSACENANVNANEDEDEVRV